MGSEARSVDFSDFPDAKPAGWTPLPHQLPECLWGAGQKEKLLEKERVLITLIFRKANTFPGFLTA